MMKYLILSASFTAVALGSYVFVRNDNSDVAPLVANPEFVSATLESVQPQPALSTTKEPQLVSEVQPADFVRQADTSLVEVNVASSDVKTPAPRPESAKKIDVGDARANLSDATFAALRSIEKTSGVRVNEPPRNVASLDIQQVVARSLAQSQGSTYAAAVNLEAKDTRVVEAPKQAMFANTLISQTRRPTLAVVHTTNAQDSAYIAQLNDVSAPPKRLAHAKKYTVKRGDNLSRISYIHYGRTSDYITIFQANRDRIKNPNQIMAGQKLIIPAL